ncbi:hypothetical protein ACFY05_27470 [Microtetraspora fusca]|uniref:Uncharacterized protein n=1 Tax=Microtetraspora fusca TaxID=1997 RepID=A0ABW6VBJ8_MICFU
MLTASALAREHCHEGRHPPHGGGRHPHQVDRSECHHALTFRLCARCRSLAHERHLAHRRLAKVDSSRPGAESPVIDQDHADPCRSRALDNDGNVIVEKRKVKRTADASTPFPLRETWLRLEPKVSVWPTSISKPAPFRWTVAFRCRDRLARFVADLG